MNKDTDWVVIGRFGRTHGIKGQITVHAFTDPPENILNYSDWHAQIGRQWKPIKIVRLDKTDKHLLAVIEGYNTREDVAALTNVDIGVDRGQLPPLPHGEYYWHELLGMAVVNKQNVLLGTVSEILPTGSNDVLVVEGEKRNLIPYLPDQFILTIDSEKKVITVDWEDDF